MSYRKRLRFMSLRARILALATVLALGAVLCLVAILNAGTVHGLQPIVVKGTIESRGDIEYEKWNSYSRVHVGYPVKAPPMLWSPSDRMPPSMDVWQRPLDIDGSAYTNMFGFDLRQGQPARSARTTALPE